ncbi:MAG: hypothetical protein MZU95_15470 [Desulfomicrobium escambiense]|nr:hypothetical protein [Desulfomicrobium escambiense]
MNRRKILNVAAILAAAMAASAPLAAQTLAPSAKVPAADGTVAPEEYAYSSVQKDMTVHLSLSADGKTLYAGPGGSYPGVGGLRPGLAPDGRGLHGPGLRLGRHRRDKRRDGFRPPAYPQPEPDPDRPGGPGDRGQDRDGVRPACGSPCRRFQPQADPGLRPQGRLHLPPRPVCLGGGSDPAVAVKLRCLPAPR